MRAVCVFCGSSAGRDPAFRLSATAAGTAIAQAGLSVVYGGGKVGLMGALADGALAAGGRAIGVIPRSLVEREIGHAGLSELHVVETMQERKTKMADLADAFIALPGGAGTLDEFFEQWTWAQLGIHSKPCGLLNVKGYFGPLISTIERIVQEGFMAESYSKMLVIEASIEPMLRRFSTYSPPAHKWHAAEA